MKKVLVAIVALFCSVSSFAQYSSGGFSLDEENLYWGVRFGLTRYEDRYDIGWCCWFACI